MAEKCSPCVASGANPGLVLGALLGEACLQGKDKLVLICDSPINSFGTWLEQLIAESTGKDGKGIVPIEGMPSESFLSEAEDILYVYLKGNGENAAHVKSLVSAMQPVIEIEVSCPYQLGAEFYRWEYATAIASAVIGVNGFNQPDVQDSKTRTAANVAEFRKTGKYPESEPIWKGMNSYVYGKPFPGLKTAASLDEVVERFLDEVKPVDYIAVKLYIPRNPENVAKAQEIRKIIGKATDRVVTVGFGPRFLHSTGQLHKGGANNGLFLLVTADPAHDMEIPNQGMTFGNLERAQALGDLEALVARERRVIRIHLTDGKIERLVS